MWSLLLAFMRLVPKNALSRAVGALVRGRWTRGLHQRAIRWFIRRYDVDVSELEHPIESYATFADFFTRRLTDGARPMAEAPEAVVSPSDGRLGACGTADGETVLQAKGRPYSVAAFLGSAELAARFSGGTYVTVYLSPRDYHRVHFPCSGRIEEAVHLPGTLWPVNPPAVERIEDLFAVNERLVTSMVTDRGPVAVVMVGATCVGRIRMSYDDLLTNAGVRQGRRRYDPPLDRACGEELGVFEMGSTVVLLFAAGAFELDEGMTEGVPVRAGSLLGRWT